jgi:RNA polymerase sigma-70 factor (ECF subfamily)
VYLNGNHIDNSSKEFEGIFKRYFTSLCIFSDKIIHQENLAKDIVQEAFLKVWKSDNAFENENALKAYLYVVTKNLSIHHLRKNKVREITNPEKLNLIDNDFVLHEIIREETYRMLSEAIHTLGIRSQAIVGMMLEGKSNAEIAEALNISVNTVKTMKARSTKTLKKILGKQFVQILLGGFWF